MTKIDIISGFLGAGKTTLIKKLLSEALSSEKVVLIENEFGEIGIDSGFLQEAGIQVTEMSSGCICCSLVGDFGEALHKVITEYHPDRVLIEPSGVGKLSDVVRAVEDVAATLPVSLNSFVTVADAGKSKMYIRNFGEFYLDQVQTACAILLTRTADIAADKLDAAVALLREHNAKARIVTTPWRELTGAQLLEAMEQSHSLADQMLADLAAQKPLHDHAEHDHHHAHGEGCSCGHDHDEHDHHHAHGEGCSCGHDHAEHDHHHAHGEGCSCGHDHAEHDHHHAHGEGCSCGHDHAEHDHHHAHGEGCSCGHDHANHEHHHAEEVFSAWGTETPRKFGRAELEGILNALDGSDYGMILRAKGIVPSADGGWLHFDYVPGEFEVRDGTPDYTGRLCVIGASLDDHRIRTLFGV